MMKAIRSINLWYDRLKEPYRFFLFLSLVIGFIGASVHFGMVALILSMLILFAFRFPYLLHL
jgi:hypothetical protein